MKVIDLLNKIANGETFKFRIDDENYYIDKSNYICEEDGTRVEWYIYDEWLNMNAEVIEEDKKIEKLDYIHPDISCSYNESELLLRIEANKDKINEIIDKINEEK